MTNRPPPVRTDPGSPWVHHSMKKRLTDVLNGVLEFNPDYGVDIVDAVVRLRDDILNDAPIAPIDPPFPVFNDWLPVYEQHMGESWLNTEWFYAEVFVYCHLILAVQWPQTRRDPFRPKKLEELGSSAMRDQIDRALAARDLPTDERLQAGLHRALWGNRIDLSYDLSKAHGSTVHDDDLLVDDSEAAVKHILGTPGDIHYILDNTGTELANDLVLIDSLLAVTSHQVIVHTKVHPTFVSDATFQDVAELIDRMHAGSYGDAAKAMAARLDSHDEERLIYTTDFVWNSAHFHWELPPQITSQFKAAALVIFKGDLNYRRLTGDALWLPDTPFAQVMAGFPTALLAMRTLKSETIAGLAPGHAEWLDSQDQHWRVNGKRGVLQFVP